MAKAVGGSVLAGRMGLLPGQVVVPVVRVPVVLLPHQFAVVDLGGGISLALLCPSAAGGGCPPVAAVRLMGVASGETLPVVGGLPLLVGFVSLLC